MEIDSLTILEAKVQNQGVDKTALSSGALKENPFFASFSLWWLLAILGILGL